MKLKLLAALCLVAFAVTTFTAARPAPQAAASGASLYKRLGGYDALAAVTDDFIGRLASDKQLARFFGGLSSDSQKRLRQHVVDFLCAATGGPCFYTGRDMKTAHSGLNITDADWEAAVSDLKATLAKFKVPDKEQSEVLAAISSLKPDIVGH
jgi:hemoglobin